MLPTPPGLLLPPTGRPPCAPTGQKTKLLAQEKRTQNPASVAGCRVLKFTKITRLAFENFRNITLKKTHKLYALVNAWLGLWGGWRGPGGEVTLKLMPE